MKGAHFKIGIMIKKDNLPCDIAFSDEKDGYAFYSLGELRNGTNQHTKEYGRPFGNEDVVGVYFDTRKGYLAYFLNREFQGPAFMSMDFKTNTFIPAAACLIEDEAFCIEEVYPED